MILYLDTSTEFCKMKLDEKEYVWHSGRDLAEGLLKFILEKLTENNKKIDDITKIIFMRGPGSFMGLRIGASVVNTLATEMNIPLFDHHGNRHKIILPEYGKPANITPPRK